jgi:hypothetical protein
VATASRALSCSVGQASSHRRGLLLRPPGECRSADRGKEAEQPSRNTLNGQVQATDTHFELRRFGSRRHFGLPNSLLGEGCWCRTRWALRMITIRPIASIGVRAHVQHIDLRFRPPGTSPHVPHHFRDVSSADLRSSAEPEA